MNVVVIEDEQAAARRLKRMLTHEGLNVIAVLHTVADAVSWFKNHAAPELVFLDIQLSDGLSFDIFEQTTLSSPIVFTTAFDEYALQAFKLNSIDYLLKPIDAKELSNAIKKYHHLKPTTPVIPFNFEDIKEMLWQDRTVYKERFTVQVGQHIKIFQVPEIVCFYSENKGTYALLASGRTYLMNKTLEGLEPMLNPELFFKISRKCIIHLPHIQDIVSYTSARLVVKIAPKLNIDLVVSRERVKDFKLWIS